MLVVEGMFQPGVSKAQAGGPFIGIYGVRNVIACIESGRPTLLLLFKSVRNDCRTSRERIVPSASHSGAVTAEDGRRRLDLLSVGSTSYKTKKTCRRGLPLCPIDMRDYVRYTTD